MNDKYIRMPSNVWAPKNLLHSERGEVHLVSRLLTAIVMVNIIVGLASAQDVAIYEPYSVTTLAGLAGAFGSTDGVGSIARFRSPQGIAIDNTGNIYVTDGFSNHTVRKLSPSGTVTTFAGLAGSPGMTDGTGANARFSSPSGIAVDNIGNIYVCDSGNNTVRKISPTGDVTTMAGSSTGASGSADGVGGAARFSNPKGIAVDGTGNVYVADYGNNLIRKVTSSGAVSTLAGTAGVYGANDGVGTNALFSSPYGIAVDKDGNVYVSHSYGGSKIRKISPKGDVSTIVAGDGDNVSYTLYADGVALTGVIINPTGIAVDGKGALYVADRFSSAIRKITPDGILTTIAGKASDVNSGASGNFGVTADGIGATARFNHPSGIAFDSSGVLYIADTDNGIIRKGALAPVASTAQKIVANPISLSAIAGNTATFTALAIGRPMPSLQWMKDGVQIVGATKTALMIPNVQAADAGTYTLVASNSEGSIRSDGAILSVATSNAPLITSQPSFSGQVANVGASASLIVSASGSTPISYQWLKDGVLLSGATSATLFLSNIQAGDAGSYSVVVSNSGGAVTSYPPATLIVNVPLAISTFAGQYGSFGSVDGTGSQARLYGPGGIAVDNAGNLYVTDLNSAIRKVTSSGVVSTLAGLANTKGSNDGSTTTARFNNPTGIAVDGSNNIYIADTNNHAIRKITSSGVVTTIAGLAGSLGFADGIGNIARFNHPTGLAVDKSGNIYVADSDNDAIRKVAPTGLVSTIPAGGYGSLDGSDARFDFPNGVAVDDDGNIYVADTDSQTIRKVSQTGIIFTKTFAGKSDEFHNGGSADGVGSAARFSYPRSIAVDRAGTLFVADTNNLTIRRISVSGAVTTVAGLAGKGGGTDGTGSSARFGGPFCITVDATGTVYIGDNATIRKGVPAVPAPQIQSQAQNQTIIAGGSATFTIGVSGTGPFSYQWQRNGVDIASATNATLQLGNVQLGDAGNYTVVVANIGGSATSAVAVLTVVSAAQAGRLVNLSILSSLATPGDTFTMGYVVGGAGTSGSKSLVIRAAGPSLGALGVPGTLADPKIELFAGSTKTGENDNWGGATAIATAMASVGAFAYVSSGSKDAATVANITGGDNSVRVSASDNGTGAVIAEIYDATTSASITAITPRLVNVSVLKNIGSRLTAGFVVGGLTSRTVLIRAVGPTLGAAPFSVPGVVADPQLTLFAGQTAIGSNDNWGTPVGSGAATATQMAAAFTQVGAFALIAGSKDAALLATLTPGNYTVQVSGVSNTTGIALVEVYEVP